MLITLLLPLPPVPVEGRVHPLSLLRLIVGRRLRVGAVLPAGGLAGDQTGTAAASARCCGPDLAIKSDLVLALAVNILNLIPGSIVLEIDQDRRLIYVHVIDVGSEKAVDSLLPPGRQMERLLVATFERDADWRPSTDKEDAHDDHLDRSPRSC